VLTKLVIPSAPVIRREVTHADDQPIQSSAIAPEPGGRRLGRLLGSLSPVSRAVAQERRRQLMRGNQAAPATGQWAALPVQLILVLEVIVAITMAATLGISVLVGSVVLAYFIATYRRSGAADQGHVAVRPRPRSIKVIDVSGQRVEVRHDLSWLDATIATARTGRPRK
jgi:hypothetical protein